jgi:hypothetical protein
VLLKRLQIPPQYSPIHTFRKSAHSFRDNLESFITGTESNIVLSVHNVISFRLQPLRCIIICGIINACNKNIIT